MRFDRRFILSAAAPLALVFATAPALPAPGNPGHDKVVAAIKADQDAAIERLRAWIALPTIANKGVNTPEGAEYMRQLALEAGFQNARIVETGGVPGVLATLDAGARHTLAVYFMYDVKHYDPAEWSSSPLAGKIVDRPGEGQALVAAALFGDAGKLKFTPLTPVARFLALQSGEVDILCRNVTLILQRDTALGLNFAPQTFTTGRASWCPRK